MPQPSARHGNLVAPRTPENPRFLGFFRKKWTGEGAEQLIEPPSAATVTWSRARSVDNWRDAAGYPRQLGRGPGGNLVAALTETCGSGHGNLVAQTYIRIPISYLPVVGGAVSVDNPAFRAPRHGLRSCIQGRRAENRRIRPETGLGEAEEGRVLPDRPQASFLSCWASIRFFSRSRLRPLPQTVQPRAFLHRQAREGSCRGQVLTSAVGA